MKSLKEIEMTKYDECYLVVYTIKVNVNIKKNGVIEKTDMYVLIGLNSQGRRKYIGSYLDDKSNHRYWLDVFETIKNKGIKDIIFIAVDDNKFLKKCVKVSFPNVLIVPSLLDIVDSFYKYFSDKYSTKIRTEIKSLYLCETLIDYQNNYDLFIEKYGKNSVFNSLISRYLNNIKDVYNYDLYVRKALFNDYMLKVLKNNILKLNKNNKYYNDVNDIINLVVDKINNIELFTSYTKKEWLNILEPFYKSYKERLEQYL